MRHILAYLGRSPTHGQQHGSRLPAEEQQR